MRMWIPPRYVSESRGWMDMPCPPIFTMSVDVLSAAIRPLGIGYEIKAWPISKGNQTASCDAYVWRNWGYDSKVYGHGTTPALALAAAVRSYVKAEKRNPNKMLGKKP